MSDSAAAGDTQEQPQQPPQTADALSEKMEKMNISTTSFSIWPPTQSTRDAVINRLIETLSTPSVLSKRYGTMSPDEASSTAKSIEEEAYNAAASSAAASSVSNIDEGIEILQVYSKEISKRMLEAVKSKGSVVAPHSDISNDAPESDRATVASEDVSSSIDESSNN